MANSNDRQETKAKLLSYGALTFISIYCIIPFFWMFLASVDGRPSQFLAWPEDFTLGHYVGIFAEKEGFRWMFNSLIIVGSTTVLVTVLGGLGGYALSRSRGWWKRPFLYTIILIRVVPPTALVVPLYKVLLGANLFVGGIVRSVFPAEWYRPIMQWVGFIDGYLGDRKSVV